MVGIAGPYDFLPIVGPTLKEIFPEDLRHASQPVNFVDGGEGPALFLHGLLDNTVKPRNSAKLAELAESAGARAEVKIYADRDHIGVLIAFAKPFRRLASVLEDVDAFLQSLENL